MFDAEMKIRQKVIDSRTENEKNIIRLYKAEMYKELINKKPDSSSTVKNFLSFAKLGVPRFYKSIEYDGELFILMEYLDGNNLQKCDRKSLTAVLD